MGRPIHSKQKSSRPKLLNWRCNGFQHRAVLMLFLILHRGLKMVLGLLLRLNKFPSPAVFFLNYLSFSSTLPLLSSALLLESWGPLFPCLSPLHFCPTTLRNFSPLFRTLAFLLKTNPAFTRRCHPLFSYN